MRIIGYLDTQGYKTTVFKNNEKYIVKFEADVVEQTFKFRETDKINSLKAIQDMVDAPFLKLVEERFQEMYESSGKLLQQFHDFHEDDWIEII